MLTERDAFTAKPVPQAQLHARVTPDSRGSGKQGLHSIALANGSTGLLYVPPDYSPEHPMPLIVVLHGARQLAQRSLDLARPMADEFGAIVFAPQATARTWDLLAGGYGPDVTAIDAALSDIFSQYAVDPTRIAIGGFSDGASYALSLGVKNGDLFTAIVAFSPGFADPYGLQGEPRVFVSHGTQDNVLPIDRCSRVYVPLLRRLGYEVHYVEFDGAHAVPEHILRSGYEWFVGDLT
jgi:phospholipase/carboxylesterase